MTRANVVIIAGYPAKHYFEKGGDGYLSGVMEDIFNFVQSISRRREDRILGVTIDFWDRPDSSGLSTFIEDCNLTLGHVGNFSYAYEIDLNKQTIKAWDYKTSWVNAPLNWEEKGWSCYKGKNGKYGYDNFVKGKKLVDIKFSDAVKLENDFVVINEELLEKIIKD